MLVEKVLTVEHFELQLALLDILVPKVRYFSTNKLYSKLYPIQSQAFFGFGEPVPCRPSSAYLLIYLLLFILLPALPTTPSRQSEQQQSM